MKKAALGIGFFALIIGSLLIVFPFVYIPKTVSEPYEVPMSSVIKEESFVVPPGEATHALYLNEGDILNIQVTVTSGGNRDIDFSVSDGSTTYLSYSRVTTVSKDWTVPLSSNYNFVYDNGFSLITSKGVTVHISKQWSEIAYRDVTENRQLLPFEVSYVGIGLVIFGVALVAYGVIRRENMAVPPPPP